MQVLDLFKKKKAVATKPEDSPDETPHGTPDEEIAKMDKLLAEMESTTPKAKTEAAPGSDLSASGAAQVLDSYNKKRKKIMDEL